MKKVLLMGTGLTALLASCGDLGGGGVTYGPVNITGLYSYTSDYYTERVENGQTVRDYVVCVNRDTRLYMDTAWTGPLAQLAAKFTYTTTGGTSYTNTVSTATFAPDTSGRDTFTYTIGANTLNATVKPLAATKGAPNLAAQQLQAQAIVVNPARLGTVAVDLWGYNPNGVKSNVLEAPQTIPVVQCP